MKLIGYVLLLCLMVSCHPSDVQKIQTEVPTFEIPKLTKTALVVLGNVQDAGSPHIACKKACCADLFEHPDPTRKVVSLGLYDKTTDRQYLLEASPDISEQLKILKKATGLKQDLPHGIFLTHAHIGHYTGLMYLGKEATNAKQVPVYAMPLMKAFLTNNGPWSQLVSTNNISLQSMQENSSTKLSDSLEVIPFKVPHRDEYSETVGFKIMGPQKSALFIPDIDKWERWDKDIEQEIAGVDYAFLDATFYWGQEINLRDISQIPHPFIQESMQRFEQLEDREKAKIHFIHFNHTNPVLDENSEQYKEVIEKGFNIAHFLDVFDL